MKIVNITKTANEGVCDVTILISAENEEERNCLRKETRMWRIDTSPVNLIGYMRYLRSIKSIDDISTRNENGDLVFKSTQLLQRVYVNNNSMLSKTDDRNVFEFSEYFVDSPTVNAILSELQLIKDGGDIAYANTTVDCHIMRLLRALERFWD